MVQTELLQLIRSLSSAEKRNFKLLCKKQIGDKDYLQLFNLINEADKDVELKSIKINFNKKFPTKSFENTAQYLFKTITDSLIQVRIINDKWFQQHYNIMGAKILLERSLVKEGFKELKKAQKTSLLLQDNFTHYQACRYELDFLTNHDFIGVNEQALIDKQMKAKRALRITLQTHEHNSLFETLRHRFINSGVSISDGDKEKLNDLVLGELSLSDRGSSYNFESQKLHLLFQSFFFINIGDYKSSLNSFTELNALFEKHSDIWNYPPYDYLSTLEGILDNLRTIKYYQEMYYFIDKLKKLVNKNYPGNFEIIVNQMIITNELCVLVNTGKTKKAIEQIKTLPSSMFKVHQLINYEIINELYFYIGLALYKNNEFKNANKYIGDILFLEKTNFNSSVFKASRLLHIIVHYQLGNNSYLDYTIRSYKRAFKKVGKELKIETLLLNVVTLDPKRRSKAQNANSLKKAKVEISKIESSNYEKQILKYFDFCIWIKEQFNKNL